MLDVTAATRRPVLVTGAHRSGTTWVGDMLAGSGEMAYVHEPFNVHHDPGWLPRPLPHWFLYVCEDNEERYAPMLEGVFGLRFPLRGRPGPWPPRRVAHAAKLRATSALARTQKRRVLMKDPLALLSAEWLARRFGAQPVVMIRHPAGFASSLDRLGWRFDFRNWLDQPLLMRDLFGPFEDDLHALVRREHDVIDEAGLMWRVLYSVVHEMRDRHPDWVFLRHEDLASDPVGGFARLYARLGLAFERRVAAQVARSARGPESDVAPSSLGRGDRNAGIAARAWTTRLCAADVERVRRSVGDVAAHFYDASTWEVAA